MGGGGGGGGHANTTNEQTVRYASYIEGHHKTFLNRISEEVTSHYHDSPYEDFDLLDMDAGFFGVGYALASFPSLYDMYGKFMAGLNIDALANQIFEDTVNTGIVSDMVEAEANLLRDHVDTKILAKFQTGMRDINAVLSSSYVIGKSIIADSQVKAIEKFSSEARYKLIPIAHERWSAHLEWNKSVVRNYAEILKLFISSKLDTEGHNIGFKAKNSLWPFTILEYQRAALGALQGASNVGGGGGEASGPSKTASAIGGALSGAAAGYQMSGGSWYGAAAGAVVGGAASYL